MRIWAKPAVAAAFIAVVVSFVDWRESLRLLSDLRSTPGLLAVLLLTVGLALSTLKWQVLLAVHAVRRNRWGGRPPDGIGVPRWQC